MIDLQVAYFDTYVIVTLNFMLYVMFSEGAGHEMCFTHRHCSCDRSTSKTCKKWQNSFELNCMLKYLFLYLFFN